MELPKAFFPKPRATLIVMSGAANAVKKSNRHPCEFRHVRNRYIFFLDDN